MKRSGPPKRKKPLKRSPLKRGKSRKAQGRDKEFKDGVTGFEVCELCGVRPGTDPDHRLSRARRPDLRNDPSNRRMLCRPCHIRVTDYPDEVGVSYELSSEKIFRKGQDE